MLAQQATSMAFPFLYSWWQDSSLDCVDHVPEEDLQLDSKEQEEEDVCWLLAEIILIYILVFGILKIFYLLMDMVRPSCKLHSWPFLREVPLIQNLVASHINQAEIPQNQAAARWICCLSATTWYW